MNECIFDVKVMLKLILHRKVVKLDCLTQLSLCQLSGLGCLTDNAEPSVAF